jgi:uncharacterized protein (DUF169 family)
MIPLQTDLSIFAQFNFERPPIGVKFQFFKPENVASLSPEKSLSLCEMLDEAHKSPEPFYFGPEYAETCVGKILLGMQKMEPFAESGQIGECLQVFQEARSNYALYQHVPKFPENVVRYVIFSPIDKLQFDPDVLILVADPSQAEILMRSMTYSTGELYVSQTTPVMGCAWIFIYPFQTGKVNYLLPEFVHGMKGRELFPKGSVLVSIPHQWLPTMTANLKKMTWHLSSHHNRADYLKEFGGILSELSKKVQNS